MLSKQQWQYFEFEPNIFDLWLFQKLVNTILFLRLKILPISTIFFNLCRPLCVYARYICTNLIVYFVNKREDFLWKAPKWENEIYLKEMERPISLRLCKVYYSMARDSDNCEIQIFLSKFKNNFIRKINTFCRSI